MADATTVLGIPFPEGADAFSAQIVEDLATRVDETPGIESLTTAEITGLAAGEKPAGRVVYNSTTSKLQVSNGTSFANVDAASLLLAGGTMSGNIDVGDNYLLNVKASGASADAATVGQVAAVQATFTGGETDVASGGTYIDLAAPPSGKTWALTASGSGASGGIGIKVGKTTATRFTVYCLNVEGTGVEGHVWWTAVAY